MADLFPTYLDLRLSENRTEYETRGRGALLDIYRQERFDKTCKPYY